MIQYPTHILIKYISKKKYLKEFLDGSLYMNSLSFFWNEYLLEKASRGQRIPLSECYGAVECGQTDLFEGTVFTKDIPKELEEYSITDLAYRSVGYRYCNILSFSNIKIDYSDAFPGSVFSYGLNSEMQKFGGYVAIILDKNEFIKRIRIKAEEEGYKFLCGNVSYRCGLREERKDYQGNSIVLVSKETFDIKDNTIRRDAFVKMDKYSYQNEWRVEMYRGVKSGDAYRFEIGSIKDIVEWCYAEDLKNTIDDCIMNNKVNNAEDVWYGNINRRDMRELFFRLGDNRANLLFEVGRSKGVN